jgi:DNA-binding NarL/FixJ family response regulator
MRVALIDDQPLVRNGIASLLEARGFEVVAEASDGQEGIEAVRRTRPDLVLMDLRMPVMGGLEATRMLKAEMPDLRIVILTVSDSESDLMEAVESGAQGYLLKDLEAVEFFAALAAVERGEPVIPARLASYLWNQFQRRGPSGAEPEKGEGDNLTDREWEVLRLVAGGNTNREVADRLVISENTVKFHMKGILDKLHLRNRTEVTAWAAEQRQRDPRN